MTTKNILIVGTGLFGAIAAHELSLAGHNISVVEKRNHIGGNCFTSMCDEAGCYEHVYGPHVFHTNSKKIWDYVSSFVEFNNFVVHTKVNYNNILYSFPINLMTMHQLYGVKTPAEAQAKLCEVRIPIENPANLEEYCLATVGPDLYHTFIEGYTAKQWNMHPRDLPASIIKRLPVRNSFNDNYFFDYYQGVPKQGYTALFEKLLQGISVELNTDFLLNKDNLIGKYDFIIYTGPIDAFFGYSNGILEYRSLRFDTELLDVPDFQGNAVINYTEEKVPWTRIVEHKHFEAYKETNKTLVTKEYPVDWKIGMQEYYPINNQRNEDILKLYQADAAAIANKVYFGGRLAEYRYYDMHQVVAAALNFCENFQ